ncbi:MAG: methylenetetrahydrofolate--tRNA-(uracil(54)-C(5))-methyltransferase (FADH(2)-oxidizing) TrmFO [Erysipelotrichales bacterium]|nr:methylenetetrahydrofolate--tRNA-(uracil(54)-C(5))-methyltransferase (FADH(2)-oxidizing) TrmFO [Erysipelotrichales bacterium]
MKEVTVIGAGLAGTEATYQLIKRGIPVRLYEMRPVKMTPAHKTGNFAELVCSNSLRSDQVTNAVGLLKEEMRQLDSIVMKAADASKLPSGSALAVDRSEFSKYLTDFISRQELVTVVHEEVTKIPDGPVIIASGPLTSDALGEDIRTFLNHDGFYFYDAAAPIVTRDSIDMNKVYEKSRYGYGDDDFLNCPMTRMDFMKFYRALITAETAELHRFEKEVFFEGCLPVEVMARRGEQTLLFGPLKPVGLEMPDGKRPYGVVQLRKEDKEGTMYNLVGFQTHLKWPEQKRVFRMIPGLENAEFVRYGVMHRNTYINAPKSLKPTYESKQREGLFFAGQFSGVEGYVESAGSGLVAGINMARYILGKECVDFGDDTMLGAMAHYITSANPESFQPMNANWGIFRSGVNKQDPAKKEKDAAHALERIQEIKKELLNERTD